ncbi:MAG: tyrosine-type recombinase/integrase [Ktedonobacterales bacterium]|nr:tyrosine-type recombinase/integrase [Ktedonobacterales bacterium]
MDEQLGLINHAPTPSRLDITIASWLHAKQQKSQSHKTVVAYATILHAFRARLQAQGIDLDAADPRVQESNASSSPQGNAERIMHIALTAQVFAAEPMITQWGSRPVAPATANLRLAALSSFYTYALRQGLLEGANPIARVERHKVQSYAQARPISYDALAESLNAIDLATPKGLRDYALLLTALHTGRRLNELAAMRWHDVDVRKRQISITWPRCKGGKVMYDELSRQGNAALAADALVAWMQWLAARDADPNGRAVQLARADAPLWISLSANGTFGNPLSARHISIMCEQRLGTSKVHALRHTFARALEDAGAKVSAIQARLGHTSLDTTGRYLAQLHAAENPYLARLTNLYGITDRLHPQTEEDGES